MFSRNILHSCSEGLDEGVRDHHSTSCESNEEDLTVKRSRSVLRKVKSGDSDVFLINHDVDSTG